MKFKGQNILQFYERFPDEISCLAYLADEKWANGFTCRKCGHHKFTIRKKNLARDCNRCHHVESPTAGTLFHKLRFGIRKAFSIVFEMSTTTKGLSASMVAKRYGISRFTAWSFMHRVRSAMKSSMQNPLNGVVLVKEFALGGKETLDLSQSRNQKRKKIVGALELTRYGRIKRAYFKRIDDYSVKSLSKLFDGYISPQSSVIAPTWSAYKALSRRYHIKMLNKKKQERLWQIKAIAEQMKAWLRSTYFWVHAYHTDKYLNEYSYRLNRSIYRQNIFHGLIQRMISAQPLAYQMIKIRI